MATKPALALPDFSIDRQFVLGQAASGTFSLTAPGAQDVAQALALDTVLPKGAFDLASVHASLQGGTTVSLGEQGRSVTFQGSAGGSFELGVFTDTQELISGLKLSPQLGIAIP